MTVRLLTVVSIFVSAIASTAFTANIDVFEMGMTTVVYLDDEQDFAWVSTPTNPYLATHHAQLGITEATTELDVSWGVAGGTFDFQFDHVIEDSLGYPRTTTYGGIGFTSDVDLWLDYSFIYSFADLNGGLDLTSTMNVIHAIDTEWIYILRSVRHGGAAFLNPPSGTFTTTRHLLLEANETYAITYSIDISGGSGSGAIGTGAGSLHFTLTPVPEPATTTLLAIAGVATVIRRRSRV